MKFLKKIFYIFFYHLRSISSVHQYCHMSHPINVWRSLWHMTPYLLHAITLAFPDFFPLSFHSYQKHNDDEYVKKSRLESFHDLYLTLSGFNRYKSPLHKKFVRKHFIEEVGRRIRIKSIRRESTNSLPHKKLIMQNYVQIKIISEKFQFCSRARWSGKEKQKRMKKKTTLEAILTCFSHRWWNDCEWNSRNDFPKHSICSSIIYIRSDQITIKKCFMFLCSSLALRLLVRCRVNDLKYARNSLYFHLKLNFLKQASKRRFLRAIIPEAAWVRGIWKQH